MSADLSKPPADRCVYREVVLEPIAKQVRDLDWRMALPDVKEMATSIEQDGLIEPIVISLKTRTLICGRDRVAALCILKRKTVRAALIRCTAEEAKRIEEAENRYRRTAPRVRTAVTIEAVDNLVESGRPEPEAVREIADQVGLHPDSVRRARDRKRSLNSKRDRAKKFRARDVPKEERVKAVIDTFGIELEPEFLKGVNMVQYRLQTCLDGLATAAGPLKTLLRQHPDIIDRGRIERLLGIIEQARKDVLLERPVTLCPYCKGVPKVQQACAACLRTGYVGRDVLAKAPAELLAPPHRVSFEGRIILRDEAIGEGDELDGFGL